MWELRLNSSAVKCLVSLCLFQIILIGNIGIVDGRHIKLNRERVNGDTVIVEGPVESQEDSSSSSSFRRNLVRKNELQKQNQHNQNHHYSYSSSLSSPSLSGLTSEKSKSSMMQMHLKEPGSSSRQHNFFGGDDDRQVDRIEEEDEHSNHERYIGDIRNQEDNVNYEADDDNDDKGRHSLVNSYFDNEYSLRMLHNMECITPTKSKGYCSTFRSCVPSLFTSDGELEAPALAELISFSIGYCTMDVSGSSNVLMKRTGNRFSSVANRIICCPGSPPESGVVSVESSAEKFIDFLSANGPQVSSFDEYEHKQPLTSSDFISKPQTVLPEQSEEVSFQDNIKHEEPSIVSDETLSIKISNNAAQQPQESLETAEISSSELGMGQNDDKNLKEKIAVIPIEAFIPPEKFDTYDPHTNKFSDQILTTLEGNENGGFSGSDSVPQINDANAITKESSSSLNDEPTLVQISESSGNNKNSSEMNQISDTSENSTIIKISPEPVKGANGKFTLEKGVIIEKATSETPRPRPNPAFQTQIGETTVNIIKTEATIDSNPVLIMPPVTAKESDKPVFDKKNEEESILNADVVQLPSFSAQIPSKSAPSPADDKYEIAHSDHNEGHDDGNDAMEDEDAPPTSGSYDLVPPTTTFKYQGLINELRETTSLPSEEDSIPQTTTVQYFDSKKVEEESDKFINNDDQEVSQTQVPVGHEIVNTTPVILPESINGEGVTHLPSEQDDEQTTTSIFISNNNINETINESVPVNDETATSHQSILEQSENAKPIFNASFNEVKYPEPLLQNEPQSPASSETFPGNSFEQQNQLFLAKDPSSYELQSVDDSAEVPPHFSSVAGQKYQSGNKPFRPLHLPTLSSTFQGSPAKLPTQVHEDDSLETEHNLPYPASQTGWSIGQLYQEQAGNNKTTLALDKPLQENEMEDESGLLNNNQLQTGSDPESNPALDEPLLTEGETSASSESQESESSEGGSSSEKEATVQEDLKEFESEPFSSPQNLNLDSIQPSEVLKETLNPPVVSTEFKGSEETVLIQSDQSDQYIQPLLPHPGVDFVATPTESTSVQSSSTSSTTDLFESTSSVFVTESTTTTTTTTTTERPMIPGSSEIGGLNPQEPEFETQPEYQILSACATQDYYRSLEQDSLKQYPFLATIVGGSRPFCSGTLITDRHILTAAHFLSNITVADVFHMKVHVGYKTGFSGTEGPFAVRKVLKVIRHKGFSFDQLVNDIAILILDRPIRFSEDVHPVCLSNSPQLYSNGVTEAFETGWMEDPLMQKISPMHPFIDPHILKYFTFGYKNVTWNLQEAVTRIRTNDECQANYGFLEKSGISITDSMVCAASISEGKSCSFKGNSGAPLFISNDGKPIQVGLVSWGIGCGHFPAVFTQVSSFLPWIEKVVYRTS